ncbi:MAG: T9SS type A sorting domain-containing protein [Bacteroidia bacterium]
MKKIYVVALIVIASVCEKAKGQTYVYHKFPDSAAVWNFHQIVVMSLCPPSGQRVDDYYSIIISGDTIISSKTYHKLTTPYVQVVPSTCASCCALATGYKGAVRQDTVAKKVFIVPPSNTSEQLLYDFTMLVGDTVKGFISSATGTTVSIVQSIDSVLVGSTYRKRWNINTCYFIYLIEGVGSTYGLIEPSPGCTVDFPSDSITCFKQNGLALYPNTATNCQLITSVNSIDKNSNQITIYPNPANGIINVKLGIMNETATIEIYNTIGECVHRQIVKSSNSQIDVSDLSEGVYNISLQSKEGTINKRIVIVK